MLIHHDGRSRDGAEGSLSPGVTIGRYVVQALVGRGAMGEVYAAHDPELNRKVAIKVLRARRAPEDPSNRSHDRSRQSLMREAQSIARLSHPNVVVIHDVGRFEDTVFIAMEFVDGCTVRYWLLAQQRPWHDVLRIFARAGAGLAAAHEKELVHRDFKPDNVMIRSDGQVRVMDFGLARTVPKEIGPATDHAVGPSAASGAPRGSAAAGEDLQATTQLDGNWSRWQRAADPGEGEGGSDVHDSGTMVGTPAYMAPEQFQGAKSDAYGDQFSFCVSLYEALYGEGPFRGNTVQERAANVNAGRVADAPLHVHVPSWIRKVLLRGLAVNPHERWPSMKDLLSRLDANARRLAEIDEWLAERGAGHSE